MNSSDSPTPIRPRASRIVALAVLSPALLALSGCASRAPVNTSNRSDCDANQSTPQTEDDCNRRRTGAGTGAGVVGGVLAGQALRNAQRNAALRNAQRNAGQRGSQPGAGRQSSPRGGFGGLGGFYSGGGS